MTKKKAAARKPRGYHQDRMYGDVLRQMPPLRGKHQHIKRRDDSSMYWEDADGVHEYDPARHNPCGRWILEHLSTAQLIELCYEKFVSKGLGVTMLASEVDEDGFLVWHGVPAEPPAPTPKHKCDECANGGDGMCFIGNTWGIPDCSDHEEIE